MQSQSEENTTVQKSKVSMKKLKAVIKLMIKPQPSENERKLLHEIQRFLGYLTEITSSEGSQSLTKYQKKLYYFLNFCLIGK